MKTLSLYEFGGSETLLREFHSRFIPFFRGHTPVLDLGCGRGVFLGLAAEAGIEAVGVDHSQESLEICRRKGFAVHHENAIRFLSESPRRFGGIFCSHLIEHMSYEEATRFLDLCHQALVPGGRLLVVTPNPEDLAVISQIFWLDPTHVRPYPKLLVERMLTAAGFHVIYSQQLLGSWRMIGRRKLPAYFLRRMLLGRYYGRPNTVILAGKNNDLGQDTAEKVSCQNRP
jgi:2-polyprenyl-3-methyl-5-hydroxy-6-metoxy-1,4-benzoquinol methylase